MPTGGSSGAAGASGSAGRGGSGAAGTPAPPMPVACGSTMCYPPQNPLSGLLGGMALPIQLPMAMACCIDESNGTCGTMAAAGATCEPRATPDTRCPGVNLGALGAAAGGLGGLFSPCCTPSNQCGLDGMLFGRGCVENSEVSSVLGALGGLITLPPARACDAVPQDDAGAADAGI